MVRYPVRMPMFFQGFIFRFPVTPAAAIQRNRFKG